MMKHNQSRKKIEITGRVAAVFPSRPPSLGWD